MSAPANGESEASQAAPLGKCQWCGEAHGPLCPYVKAIEFEYPLDNEPRRVKRVEFLTSADFPVQNHSGENTPQEPDYPRYKPGG